LGGRERKEGRKQFFFEKKNQETFISFLVLSFKKELLPLF